MKRSLIIFLIAVLELSAFPLPAHAQEVVSPVPTTPDVSSLSIDPQLLPEVLKDQDMQPSANFRARRFVQRLMKKSYQAKEEVQVIVKNAVEDTLSLEVTGGLEVADVEKTQVNGDTIFTIQPSARFKPGKYEVSVTDTATSEVLSTQEFTWGVLAINTDKSIYQTGEKANIALAVLDEAGNMVCSAEVSLEVLSPNGAATTLSTKDGTILVNPACRMHSFTMDPDYEASYQTAESGRYVTTLTATTGKGSYTIRDRFEVRDFVPFAITRDTATRVYPPSTYPVTMRIHAQEDFSGKIVETVPMDFQISQLRDDAVPYDGEQAIKENIAKERNAAIPTLHLPFTGDHTVTLGFGQQIDDPDQHDVYKKSGLDGHDGIDFDMPEGTPVLSADAGRVILAQEKWIYGTSVVIEHAWGRTYYGHLSRLDVGVGDLVEPGSQIGLSGSTGLSTGPHLHFGLKPKQSDINNLYFGKIDPAPYFGISSEDPVLSVASYPGATKALVWNVELHKGDQITIGYQFKAPNKSPDFYTIGPLQFISADLTASQQTKFDVKTNPFVLGASTANNASKSLMEGLDFGSSEKTKNSPPPSYVVFEEIRAWQLAIDAATTTIITTAYTDSCGSNCWTVPSNWNSANNTIEVIGAGGNGVTSTTLPGGGGGGGGYALASNQSFTPGNTVSFTLGAGGSGTTSWFNTSGTLAAAAGSNASGRTHGNGGAGSGSAATITRTGGNGGDGGNLAGSGAGGGGGAAGPNGNGGTGGSGTATANTGGGGGGGNGSAGTNTGSNATGTNGANGGNGNGGSGGGAGGAGTGGNGTVGTGGGGAGGAGNSGGAAFAGGDGAASIDLAAGSAGTGGGGGGGGGTSRTAGSGNNGGAGGQITANTGAGGGGGGDCTDAGCTEGAGRTGSAGFIIITYTPNGPTLDQLLRHGKWFDGSASPKQQFTF